DVALITTKRKASLVRSRREIRRLRRHCHRDRSVFVEFSSRTATQCKPGWKIPDRPADVVSRGRQTDLRGVGIEWSALEASKSNRVGSLQSQMRNRLGW